MRVVKLGLLVTFFAASLMPSARAQDLAIIHNSGHSNSINTLAFSPDSRWIASGSDDSTIKVWDRIGGRLLRTLTGHSKKVTWLGILPDARTLVSLSGDEGIAKVWDASTGTVVRNLGALKNPSNDILQDKGALSVDGKFLFTNSSDAIRRIDLASGKVDRIFPKPGTFATWQTFALSPDDRLIAAAHSVALNAPLKYAAVGSQVKLLDAATGRLVRVLGTHDTRESVTTIAFFPDGRLVASGGYDGIARVWEVATGRLLFTLNHSEDARSRFLHTVTFSSDSRNIVTVGGKDGLKFWSAQNGTLVRQLKGKPYEWSNVATYSIGGDVLASASVAIELSRLLA